MTKLVCLFYQTSDETATKAAKLPSLPPQLQTTLAGTLDAMTGESPSAVQTDSVPSANDLHSHEGPASPVPHQDVEEEANGTNPSQSAAGALPQSLETAFGGLDVGGYMFTFFNGYSCARCRGHAFNNRLVHLLLLCQPPSLGHGAVLIT